MDSVTDRLEILEARVAVLQATMRLLVEALAKTLDRDAEIVLNKLDTGRWVD